MNKKIILYLVITIIVIITLSLYFYLESKKVNEVKEYEVCDCCCPGQEPLVSCLYKSKGDRIEDIIEKYKNRKSDCSQFGCSKPVLYKYCD